MRCYAIYKAKNMKSWKITEKIINYLLTFDKIIHEDTNGFALKNYVNKYSNLIRVELQAK
jgi:hypothetical protein